MSWQYDEPDSDDDSCYKEVKLLTRKLLEPDFLRSYPVETSWAGASDDFEELPYFTNPNGFTRSCLEGVTYVDDSSLVDCEQLEQIYRIFSSLNSTVLVSRSYADLFTKHAYKDEWTFMNSGIVVTVFTDKITSPPSAILTLADKKSGFPLWSMHLTESTYANVMTKPTGEGPYVTLTDPEGQPLSVKKLRFYYENVANTTGGYINHAVHMLHKALRKDRTSSPHSKKPVEKRKRKLDISEPTKMVHNISMKLTDLQEIFPHQMYQRTLGAGASRPSK